MREIAPQGQEAAAKALPKYYKIQLNGLNKLKTQIDYLKSLPKSDAVPADMLATQDAELKKRIALVSVAAYNADTSSPKEKLVDDFVHQGKTQSCLTKEVEILTTIVSLQHTESKTMLLKNKRYLEEREVSMQRAMNQLMEAKANRLRHENKRLYKRKILRLKMKDQLLEQIRALLRTRYNLNAPRAVLVKEISDLSRRLRSKETDVLEKTSEILKVKEESVNNSTIVKGPEDGPLSVEKVLEAEKMKEAEKSIETYKEQRAASEAVTNAESSEAAGEEEQKVQEKSEPEPSKEEVAEELKFEKDKVKTETTAVLEAQKAGTATPEMINKIKQERAALRTKMKQAGKEVPQDLKSGTLSTDGSTW